MNIYIKKEGDFQFLFEKMMLSLTYMRKKLFLTKAN